MGLRARSPRPRLAFRAGGLGLLGLDPEEDSDAGLAPTLSVGEDGRARRSGGQVREGRGPTAPDCDPTSECCREGAWTRPSPRCFYHIFYHTPPQDQGLKSLR